MESIIHPVEHSFFEIKRIINALKAKYPFLKYQSIGSSVSGREIPALSLGCTENQTLLIAGDNPMVRTPTLMLIMLIEEMCDKIINGKEMCDINIRKVMFENGVTIVPLLNPDGAELLVKGKNNLGYIPKGSEAFLNGDLSNYKANLRGVELVMNLHPDFKKIKANSALIPCCSNFCGYKPDSEPESNAFLRLCKNNNFKKMLHITGYGETISYSDKPCLPAQSHKIAEILATVSFYKIQPPIAKNRIELNDRFTFSFEKPAFCVRVGKKPLPISNLYSEYKKIKEMLLLSIIL